MQSWRYSRTDVIRVVRVIRVLRVFRVIVCIRWRQVRMYACIILKQWVVIEYELYNSKSKNKHARDAKSQQENKRMSICMYICMYICTIRTVSTYICTVIVC